MVLAVLAAGLAGCGEATPKAREAAAVTTGRVERGALGDLVSLDGTLAFRARPDGSPYTLVNQATGTYTQLPEAGRPVGCGEVLYRVDEHAVRVVCGTVPFYRRLHPGDTGRDAHQLPAPLRDRTFRPGDAVVLPRPGRIAKVLGRLGEPARPGTPVALATSRTLEAQVALDAAQQGQVRRGDRARITLPGSRVLRGRVARLGPVAAKAGAATIPVSVRLRAPARARGLERAPVRVDVTVAGARNVLSVPVTAVVGRPGGGFAVERVGTGGRRTLVAVHLGLFDTTAGRVQVTGALRPGDRVAVPAP